MKKAVSLVAIIAAGITASQAQSVLRVHLADNSRFNISLNGRYFNKQLQSITVGDLPPGRQRVKIFALSRNSRGTTFEELVYQGSVRTFPGMITRLEYDPGSGMADVQEEGMDRGGRYQPNAMQQPADDSYGGNNPHNDNSNNNADDYANSNNSGRQSDNNSPAASPVAEGKTSSLTEDRLQQLKTRTEAEATDTKKIAYLKSGLRGERIITYDVSLMMDWLLFESSKVEFAEWAYNMVADNEFYTDLDAKLKNASSKQELDNFIKNKR